MIAFLTNIIPHIHVAPHLVTYTFVVYSVVFKLPVVTTLTGLAHVNSRITLVAERTTFQAELTSRAFVKSGTVGYRDTLNFLNIIILGRHITLPANQDQDVELDKEHFAILF